MSALTFFPLYRCQAHGNGRNNSLPDAPSPPAYVPSTAVAANTSTFGGGGSTDIGQLPSSSSITSAAVEKLTNEVVGIRVTCNSVKQECGKLRQEVASLALIQSQMREEFKHALLSIDSRLASRQSDNKVVKAAVDLSLAPRTAGEYLPAFTCICMHVHIDACLYVFLMIIRS